MNLQIPQMMLGSGFSSGLMGWGFGKSAGASSKIVQLVVIL
jgi:hypothetical protein